MVSLRGLHPDDVDRFRAERHEGLLRGAPFEYEMRWQKGGQYRWHLVQYNPLKDEQDRIIRWYATATDIDDRKRTEEKLRQSEREARQLLDLSPIHIGELGLTEFLSITTRQRSIISGLLLRSGAPRI